MGWTNAADWKRKEIGKGEEQVFGDVSKKGQIVPLVPQVCSMYGKL